MRPDPATPLALAAARRHELTRGRAIQALRELDRAGAPVTFASVAAAAGVSRSWLYTQPDIRDQIQQLRQVTWHAPGPPVPASQRASDASLRARLIATLERNQALAEETPGYAASSPARSATSAQPGRNPATGRTHPRRNRRAKSPS